MENKKKKNKATLLPHGWAKRLMDECNVSRPTVTQAIRYNMPGEAKDKVRAKCKEIFGYVNN